MKENESIMLSAQWRPFLLDLHVLMIFLFYDSEIVSLPDDAAGF